MKSIERRLCTPLLPIIVNPTKPHVAMPLPGRFWTDELIDWWIGWVRPMPATVILHSGWKSNER